MVSDKRLAGRAAGTGDVRFSAARSFQLSSDQVDGAIHVELRDGLQSLLPDDLPSDDDLRALCPEEVQRLARPGVTRQSALHLHLLPSQPRPAPFDVHRLLSSSADGHGHSVGLRRETLADQNREWANEFGSALALFSRQSAHLRSDRFDRWGLLLILRDVVAR